jgi:hypothetical protein
MTQPAAVTHDPESARFTSGAAFLAYERSDGRLALLHTEVPGELEGRGVGGALVRQAVAWARGEGLEVVPLCPFAASWLERHPDV